MVFPILFNYRHAIELYLKAAIPGEWGHNLADLFQKLEITVQAKKCLKVPAEIREVVLEFEEFDTRSTTFRYSDQQVTSRATGETGEFIVNFSDLRQRMETIHQFFEQLRHEIV